MLPDTPEDQPAEDVIPVAPKPQSEVSRMINSQVAMMNLFGIDIFAPRHDTRGGCSDRREF
ncbi:hypothetical protein K8942_00460 [Candidatus Peribacteria bacterium]|nr:MAG: hypothetical protein K8942_00460 [Candidatus Peribacteria bacterium]